MRYQVLTVQQEQAVFVTNNVNRAAVEAERYIAKGLEACILDTRLNKVLRKTEG